MTVSRSEFRDVRVDHVEFYVSDALRAARDLMASYGFGFAGSRSAPDHLSIAMRQDEILLVVTQGIGDDHRADLYTQRHGDGVGNIGMATPDAAAAFQAAVSRGARPVAEPAVADAIVTAAVVGFGDVTHSFVQRPAAERDGAPLPGFTLDLPGHMSVPASAGPAPRLCGVDHFAVCLEPGTLGPTVEFYQTVFDFDQTFSERISIGTQAMFSQVVQAPSRAVTFTLIEPDPSGSPGQIDDFLKEHGGPGVQHVAFRTNNIVSSISALVERKVEFLQTPPAYYEMLSQRLDLRRYDAGQLRAKGILVDEDHDGQLFQIFARSTHPRRSFFFEVIERLGARTFGSGNIRALYEAVEAERIKTQDAM